MDKIARALDRLPASMVTLDQSIIATYVTDFRGQYVGKTRALLRPRNTEHVQEAVRVCAEFGVPLVPQGGNTSYCTAATPSTRGDELVISLERMNRVRELDRANMSMTADAGAILGDLHKRAADAGLMLPLALGSQDSCRIGGNISTNAGGISVLRYGMARELVLGLEVVLPDASLLEDLNPLRKNNSGYDIKQLFIGAEGTLGIITGVSLKLVRQPRQVVTAFLAIDEIANLSSVLDRAQVQTGESISSFEYMSQNSLGLLLAAKPQLRHPLQAASPHYVLLEAATASSVLNLDEAVTDLLAELFEDGLVVDGTIAASGQQRAEFWHLRENLPEAETLHGGSVKHDISVRTSRVAAFIASATEIVERHAPDAILSVYGHVGDGNIHFNIVAPDKNRAADYKKWLDQEISGPIHDLAASMGGSFSAEYGIGRLKLDLLYRYGDPGKLNLMRSLKRALDPQSIMNPGKVVRVGDPQR